MMNTNFQKGQTIIEVLVALTAAIIVISAVTTLITSSLRNAQFSKTQNLATHYTQEAIEVVNQLSQSDFAGFTQKSGTYCLDKGSLTFRTPCSDTVPNVDDFVRTISVSQSSNCGVGTASISAVVRWRDQSCPSSDFCHDVNLVTCIINKKAVPTP